MKNSRPAAPPRHSGNNDPRRRASATGTGKQKRHVASTLNQSHRKGGRAAKFDDPIPDGVTGTAEQGS